MAGKKTTAKETGFAQAFIRQLGGDIWNAYLVTAVVAWMRQESGGLSKVVGNNPFNLRPGKDDAKFRSGVRRSKKGNGYFSVYASLAMGARAAANRLVRAGKDWRGYDAIVAAARGKYSQRVEDQQKQARDFLKGVAMSKWDASHYGAIIHQKIEDGRYEDIYQESWNHLIKVWQNIPGVNWVPVAVKPPPVKQPPKPPPRPAVQLAINPALGVGNYIKPYAARTFYEQRHPVLAPLPSGIV